MGCLLCPPFNCGLSEFKSPASGFGDGAQGPPLAHRNAFRESLKSLEADVMHANTLLSGEMMRDSEGATLQLRLSFSPLAPLLLFLVNWADCSLAGVLGLLRVLIYKVYRNGHSTANIYERKASLRQFSGYLYPALQQLYPGLSEPELREQQRDCREKFLGKRRQAMVTCSCGRLVSASSYSGSSSSRSTVESTAGTNSDISVSGTDTGMGLSALGLAAPEVTRAGTGTVAATEAEAGAGAQARAGPGRGAVRDWCGTVIGAADAASEWRGLDMADADVDDNSTSNSNSGSSSCCRKAKLVGRERERECGICMEEHKSKVVLPSCGHCLCHNCYTDWCPRSQACPFCRRGLSRVDSGDLWEFVEHADVDSLGRITRDNIRRFFLFVQALPVVLADSLVDMIPSERRPLM